jgi:hypothetical protein
MGLAAAMGISAANTLVALCHAYSGLRVTGANHHPGESAGLWARHAPMPASCAFAAAHRGIDPHDHAISRQRRALRRCSLHLQRRSFHSASSTTSFVAVLGALGSSRSVLAPAGGQLSYLAAGHHASSCSRRSIPATGSKTGGVIGTMRRDQTLFIHANSDTDDNVRIVFPTRQVLIGGEMVRVTVTQRHLRRGSSSNSTRPLKDDIASRRSGNVQEIAGSRPAHQSAWPTFGRCR